MTGIRAMLAAAVPILGGCLSVPDREVPMCSTSSDCDQLNGEVCDEGICWGNPPAGPFSAVVSPPSERPTLASRELTEIGIYQDGWIDDIQLERAALYTARLACAAPLTCEASSLDAKITITRPSSFPGGPGFRSVVSAEGTDGFQIAVPASADATYTITIVPDGRDQPANPPSPAQLFPPLRTTLSIAGTTAGRTFELGGINLPTVSGIVKNEAGQPLANYRVVALGRWDATSAPSEVSTVDFTGTDGKFSIQLASALSGNVEVVASSMASTTSPGLRPTLRFGGISGSTGMASITLAWPQGVGSERVVAFDVKGVDGSGEVVPVRGASVRLSARVTSPTGATSVEVEGTTDENGRITLGVLDGTLFAAAYRLSIVPPANATTGVIFDEPFMVVGPYPTRQLPNRVALRGVVYSHDGEPLKDIAVTARPSLKFVWSLDTTAAQAFLAAIPAATTVTPNTGEFVVWVDPNLIDIWGHYDLVLEPSPQSHAPNMTLLGIELPRTSSTTVTLPPIELPDAAFVRANVRDADGALLEGAELKLYRIDEAQTLCTLVKNPPASCSVPATLVGRGIADADGRLQLTLPR
ncbi:MAG: hypothetical protein H0T89_00685 [Deltaproteobacteria bacterium]|nr:hypothetical protein [Deltaproteobacteria bacterium]